MPVQGDLSFCLRVRLPKGMESFVRFVLKVAEYPKAELDIAVYHMVTGSEPLSSVGITTLCRPTALPISFVQQGQVAVSPNMPIAPVLSLATKTLLSFTKPARSTAFSAKIGIIAMGSKRSGM